MKRTQKKKSSRHPTAGPTRAFFWLVAGCWLLFACAAATQPIRLQSDPSVVPCTVYCRHIRDDLRCPQGRATAGGATCEEVCSNVELSGYVRNRRLCSLVAATCEAVDRCED